jgi:hypothetical protein
MSRNNYIYVDYENVHEADFGRLAGRPAHVTLVLGERHKTLPVALVKLIQRHASQITLIETGLTAKNALDFVLACEVGAQTARDPLGFFHILSRDKGFDAVIRYLKSRDIFAARRESFAEIPVLMNSSERLTVLRELIHEKKAGFPAKRKTLESFVQSTFGKAMTPEEVEETINALIKAKLVMISETAEVTLTN